MLPKNPALVRTALLFRAFNAAGMGVGQHVRFNPDFGLKKIHCAKRFFMAHESLDEFSTPCWEVPPFQPTENTMGTIESRLAKIEFFYTGSYTAASDAEEVGFLMPRHLRRGHLLTASRAADFGPVHLEPI